MGWLKDFSDAQTYLDPTFNGENILQTGNSNWSQFNDKAINAEMDKAKLLTDPKEHLEAWGKHRQEAHGDRARDRLDLGQDPTDPSPNVVGVTNQDNGQWDLAFTSIK